MGRVRDWFADHQVLVIRSMLWFWVASIPVSIALGWHNSVTLVYALSVWAIIRTEATNLKGAQAAKEVVEAIVDDPRIETL